MIASLALRLQFTPSDTTPSWIQTAQVRLTAFLLNEEMSTLNEKGWVGQDTNPSWSNLQRKSLPQVHFGANSSHITTLAKMTFLQIFMCKPLINQFISFYSPNGNNKPLMHRFLQIWNLLMSVSRNHFCWRTSTSIQVGREVLQLSVRGGEQKKLKTTTRGTSVSDSTDKDRPS